MEQQYNRAKTWQLLFFVFNNTASNIYLSLMGFVNLYAGNVAGLAVILVSNIMMAARFWDGVTDPIVGFIVDKTRPVINGMQNIVRIKQIRLRGDTGAGIDVLFAEGEGFTVKL